ncbi:hypothetical protein CDL15_Pgr007423 [Punica granatum]|uniref:Uncharacterized protein n=1 Tax=Punica granatum TaxID=22663 RepID=A0A218X852_PUNGR|nr:hypothetical protein CDL15_Pgr007423 [Punica granatum]PKI56322.1 hypothetical protein CRG98_023341 [Punica granatum]
MEIERGVHSHKQQYQKKESRFSVQVINLDDVRKNSPLSLSPRGEGAAAADSGGGAGVGSTKSARWKNCLCSPTTHAGSFRCRFHRNSSMLRGGSVGSNLSDLATKSGRPISDSVHCSVASKHHHHVLNL